MMCLSWQQLYQVFPPVHQILLQFLRHRGPLQVLAVQADWKKAVQIALIVTVHKRNWGKVKFCLSVILFTGGGVSTEEGCVSQHALFRHPPWADNPLADTLLQTPSWTNTPWQTPLSDTPPGQTPPWVHTDV